MSVLRRLDDFRGASRFTTWVYKFALLEAAVKLRKRAWQGREVPLEPEAGALFSSGGAGPDEEAEQGELLATLQRAIDEVLTPHQRQILVALALNGVPIDVLADRLDTTRGALYKTLHDARRKLRKHLEELRALHSTPGWRRRHDGTSRPEAGTRPPARPCRARGRLRRVLRRCSTGTSSSSWRARTPTPPIPGLRAHLEGCPACREEHESLRALVGGEQAL